MNDKEIAKQLDINWQTAATWRKKKLKRGQDWRIIKTKVSYTKTGIGKMTEFKAAMKPKSQPKPTPDREEKQPEEYKPNNDPKYHDDRTQTEILVVWQLGANKRFVMAKRSNGEFVRLIINEKDYDRGIKPGRKVRAAYMESDSDIWNMIGVDQTNIDQLKNAREELI